MLTEAEGHTTTGVSAEMAKDTGRVDRDTDEVIGEPLVGAEDEARVEVTAAGRYIKQLFIPAKPIAFDRLGLHQACLSEQVAMKTTRWVSNRSLSGYFLHK